MRQTNGRNSPMQFEWEIRILVDEKWVAQGFDFGEYKSDEYARYKAIADALLPKAQPGDIKVSVSKRPNPTEMKLVMGLIDEEEARSLRQPKQL